jgi:26S proteasome non-ATPase regulatory subunit 10
MQDTRTPLHWAASAGHLDVVTYLLANDAEVDKTDDSGWTALHIAGGRDLPRSKISDEMSWF